MKRCSTALAGVFALLAPSAGAQVIQPILEVGDVLPGGFTVDAIESGRVDEVLRYAAKATDGSLDLLVTESGVPIVDGSPTPGLPGGTVTAVEQVLVNGDGDWAAVVRYQDVNGSSHGLWVNGLPILLRGAVSNAPQVDPGTTYSSLLELRAFAPGWLAVRATLLDSGGSRHAVLLLELDGSGALVSEQVPYSVGDVVPGLGALDTIGPLDSNSSGSTIFRATMGFQPLALVDGVEVLGPNVPLPIPGAGLLGGPTGVAINDAGDYAYLAEFASGGDGEQAIVRNGSVLVSTANTFPGIAPGDLSSIAEDGVLHLANDGAVLWRGTWYVGENPPPYDGLFVDDELLVQAGVTQIEGKTILSVAAGTHAISPDGRFVSFVGTLSDGTDGLITLERRALMTDAFCFGDGSGAPCPCGNEVTLSSGCRNSTASFYGPRLSSTGSVSASADDLAFQATGLVPNQPALLFVGDAAIAGGDGVGFGDGLRCAGTNVTRLGIVTPDGSGNAAWGPGLGALGGWSAGDERSFQVWYRDPSGPCGSGFNLTNARRATFTL